MNSIRIKTVLVAVCVLGLTSTLWAAPFTVTYDFTDGSTVAAVTGDGAAMVTAANATSSGIGGTTFHATVHAAAAANGQTGGSLDLAKYFQFTITAATAAPLDVLTVGYRLTSAGTTTALRSGTGVVRTDAQITDDFTIDVGTVTKGTTQTPFDAATLSDPTKWNSGTFTLADVSGINATGLTSITFRIYPSDQTSSSSIYTVIDDVVITGIVIPEPATLALLGLGGLVMIRRRRA